MLAFTETQADSPSSNGTALYVIDQARSCYLTDNVTGVSGKNGVAIATSNVTLDLNGFSLLTDSAADGEAAGGRKAISPVGGDSRFNRPGPFS